NNALLAVIEFTVIALNSCPEGAGNSHHFRDHLFVRTLHYHTTVSKVEPRLARAIAPPSQKWTFVAKCLSVGGGRLREPYDFHLGILRYVSTPFIIGYVWSIIKPILLPRYVQLVSHGGDG